MPTFVNLVIAPKRIVRAAAAGMVVCFLAVTPVQAQGESTGPEQLLEEGTQKILRAFELFILTIPQYEMPEVLPNGDIIIRRKNPPAGEDKNVPGDKAVPGSGDKTKT